MRTLYILISESLIGTHSNHNLDECVQSFCINIPINVKQSSNQKDSYINNTSLKDNNVFVDVINCYKKNNSNGVKVYFIIGFDADIQGEYMANVFKDELLEAGIDEKIIFRMPFAEGGYVALQDFKSVQAYIDYKGLEADFLSFVKRYNMKNEASLPLMNFRKILAIKELALNADKDFIVENNDGNSTFTFIVNTLSNNTTSSKKIEKRNTIIEAI
jgi:hypothetical protein